MDHFIVGATRNQIDGVNRIVARFLDEMDRSLGNQFASLSMSMDALTKNQISASRAAGENLSAAQGIVNNAVALQEMTNHILDKFDHYMNGISEVRRHDENYEERVNAVLEKMQNENKELSGLLSEFGGKIHSLSDRTELNQKDLDMIRDLMEGISRNVGKISDTVSTLSGEE